MCAALTYPHSHTCLAVKPRNLFCRYDRACCVSSCGCFCSFLCYLTRSDCQQRQLLLAHCRNVLTRDHGTLPARWSTGRFWKTEKTGGVEDESEREVDGDRVGTGGKVNQKSDITHPLVECDVLFVSSLYCSSFSSSLSSAQPVRSVWWSVCEPSRSSTLSWVVTEI